MRQNVARASPYLSDGDSSAQICAPVEQFKLPLPRNKSTVTIFTRSMRTFVLWTRCIAGGNDGSGRAEVPQRSQRAVRFRIRAGRAWRRTSARRPAGLPAVSGRRRPASAARQRGGRRRRPVPPAAIQRARPVEAGRRLPSGHLLDEHATSPADVTARCCG